MIEFTSYPWPLQPLGELFELGTDACLPNNQPWDKFLHFSLPAWDETSGPIVQFGSEIESNKFSLKRECVLVSKLNPRISRVCIYRPKLEDPPACASTEFMAYVPHSGSVCLDFFACYLRSQQFRQRLEAAATGTTNSHVRLRPSETLNWRVPVPPLAEQRAIAGILDAADDAIARARAAADAARRAKRGLVQQFFEAGLGRVSCADSPNATLAKGWQLVRTDKLLLAEPKNGISPTTESAPPGFITFSIAAVRDGRVDLLNREHWKYARISADVADPYRLNRGDILVVRGNANPDLVGKCGIVDEMPADCIYPDILKRVHFDTGPNGIDPRFAEIAWNHAVVHNQVLKRAKTSNGTLKINSRDVKQIVMPLPPRAEQEGFVALLTAAEERIRATERCVAALERLKRGLMQVLLTGRVRVPVGGA